MTPGAGPVPLIQGELGSFVHKALCQSPGGGMDQPQFESNHQKSRPLASQDVKPIHLKYKTVINKE